MRETVLITGTSSGIGLSAAVECAAAGHVVVATMRDLSRRKPLDAAAEARGAVIHVEQLDVTSRAAPDKVRELILKYGPFSALVNNAGIAVAGAFEEQSEEDARDQFETNVFGLMAVTRAALPAMRNAGHGRIINVSSISGRLAFPTLSTYVATKHAVEGFSEALAIELEPFGIEVCLVEPGTFRTGINGVGLRRAEELRPDGPYADLYQRAEARAQAEIAAAPPPDEVGRLIADLVGSGAPALRVPVGKGVSALVALRRVLPDRLYRFGVRTAIRRTTPR